MERQHLLKRTAVFLLSLCLLSTTLLGILPVPASAETAVTTVYYLDSEGWGSVSAYVYGDNGEVLGGWPGTAATADGGSWVKTTVTAANAFSVIFNGSGGQSADIYIGTVGGTYYVTKDGTHHASKEAAEEYMNPTEPEKVPTDIYFLNSDNWSGVGAYVYGDKGELLGSWGTTTATADSDSWVKVTVPDAPPFSIVFYNTSDDSQRAELYLGDASNVYVTVNSVAFVSKADAEASVAPAEPEKVPTDIYFLNSNNWAGVGAYVYGDKGELLGSWGTTTATADSGSWVKVTAPDAPPFSIVFYNTSDDSQRAELLLSDATNVYVTVNAAAFASKSAAEASIAPAEPEKVPTDRSSCQCKFQQKPW